ncbi:MAG: dihydrofolate reductase [Clostridia bacterium]
MKLIVAVDNKWGIGKDNKLLFHLKKDMAFFTETTLHKVVVMGANTFLSLPHGALKDRINIVLDDTGTPHEGTFVVKDIEELFDKLTEYENDDIFVIGGASVYTALLPYCNTALVTKVHADGEASIFIPNLDKLPEWDIIEKSEVILDGEYEIEFCHYSNIEH